MKMITLGQLAAELGMDKSALRKHCVKKGYEFGKRRTRASRGQSMNTLNSRDEAEVRREFAWRLED